MLPVHGGSQERGLYDAKDDITLCCLIMIMSHDCHMHVSIRSGWSTEGCKMLQSESLSHVICQCFHLTAFAVILPESAFEVCRSLPTLASFCTVTNVYMEASNYNQ